MQTETIQNLMEQHVQESLLPKTTPLVFKALQVELRYFQLILHQDML